MSAEPRTSTTWGNGATPGPGTDPQRGMSVAGLLGRLGDDVTALLRGELELAKAEIRHEMRRMGRAGAMFGAAALIGWIALVLLAFAGAWALALVMPLWAAFLVTAVALGLVAGGLAMAGRSRMSQVDLTPHETAESLEEDRQMLTERMSR